jgi:GNAT superfamily N-acetyltransferase
MLEIFPVETVKDIEIARILFTEYLNFLKSDFREYADRSWFIQYYEEFEKEIDNLPGRFESPEGSILLAGYNGQSAGCVALGKLSDGVCEMERLFVRPRYQRKGIGTALCKALMEQSVKAGYTKMRLATALEPPKPLYNSLGFKKIAPYRDVPDELNNVVFMEIKLI